MVALKLFLSATIFTVSWVSSDTESARLPAWERVWCWGMTGFSRVWSAEARVGAKTVCVQPQPVVWLSKFWCQSWLTALTARSCLCTTTRYPLGCADKSLALPRYKPGQRILKRDCQEKGASKGVDDLKDEQLVLSVVICLWDKVWQQNRLGFLPLHFSHLTTLLHLSVVPCPLGCVSTAVHASKPSSWSACFLSALDVQKTSNEASWHLLVAS